MDKKSVSTSWENGSGSQSHVTIKNIDVPDDLHCLMIGKTIDSEPFGNGYEMYLSIDELTKLKNILDSYLNI